MIKKKQITFYGDFSESDCLDWLSHFRKCFDITNVLMSVHYNKVFYGEEKRVRLIVRYKQ